MKHGYIRDSSSCDISSSVILLYVDAGSVHKLSRSVVLRYHGDAAICYIYIYSPTGSVIEHGGFGNTENTAQFTDRLCVENVLISAENRSPPLFTTRQQAAAMQFSVEKFQRLLAIVALQLFSSCALCAFINHALLQPAPSGMVEDLAEDFCVVHAASENGESLGEKLLVAVRACALDVTALLKEGASLHQLAERADLSSEMKMVVAESLAALYSAECDTYD
eukprot:14303-Heterococcus_DN1.PRE.1